MDTKDANAHPLDRIDEAIIDILRHDGRITFEKLSSLVHLTPRPCLERVRKLERRGLHHIAIKASDINGTLQKMSKAGFQMIDQVGRPGSRRALIGFPHPKSTGGILMHLVQRDV